MTAPPPPTKSTSRIARLLELGNDNKIIAAATLVTLATGVPYLVGTAVRAMRGQDEAVAMRQLFAEALLDSAQLLRDQAEDQQLVTLRSEIEAMVAAQVAGLEAVRDDALRDGATPAEGERLLAAVQAGTFGHPSAALAEIARIADEQQARGALAEAANTWRHRGVLQAISDGAAAVRDFQHAESIHPADADATLMLAYLLGDYEDIDIAFPVVTEAVARARAEGDKDVLAKALLWQAMSIVDTSPDFTEERGRLRLQASTEAAGLFFERILDDPSENDNVVLYATAIGQFVFGGGVRTPADGQPLLDAIAVVERTATAMTPRADEALDAASARIQLASAKGALLYACGHRDEALASWQRCAAMIDKTLGRGRRDIHYLETSWTAVYTPLEVLLDEASPEWEAAEFLASSCVALMTTAAEFQSDNPAVMRSLILATSKLGLAQSRLGKAELAAQTGAHAVEMARAARPDFRDDAPLWEFRALVVAAQIAQPADGVRARELAEEADRYYHEVVVPGPYEEWVAPHRATLDALLTELPAASD